MQFLLLKISQFVWEPWKKSHYFALKIFMVLKQIEKILYWVKLNFHGSETNWKIPLLTQANFSWFWNKLENSFTDSS